MADDLLSKLERAEGADRKDDVSLWLKFGDLWPVEEDDDLPFMTNDPLPPSVCINGLTMFEAVERYPNDIRIPSHYNVPRFTASLDAALTLVERVLPGWRWIVDSDFDRSPPYAAQVKQRGQQWSEAPRAFAPTPALALCISLLRAVKASEQTP